MTLARASTLHPKPLPTGPPPPIPTSSDAPEQPTLIFRTGKSIRRAFTTRRSSPQSAERRKRSQSARIEMIGNPVLHQDEEGKTLKTLAKMGVHLDDDFGLIPAGAGAAVPAGGEAAAAAQPPALRKTLTIQRKPVPRHSALPKEPVIVEETIAEEPEPEVESVSDEECKNSNLTTRRDKRRGFVYYGLEEEETEVPRPPPHVMDWKLHNVEEEDEDADEEENDDEEDEDNMSGQESPVSSSCAHEADPVDSIRWSFLAPSIMVKQDTLCLKVAEEKEPVKEKEEVEVREAAEERETVEEREAIEEMGVIDEEAEFSDDSSEGEDVKEMRRELESVENLLGSITASFAQSSTSQQGLMLPVRNGSLKSRFTESREDLQDNTRASSSNSRYDDESPTLGHCPTLNIIKRIEVARNNMGKSADTIESMEKAISRTEDMIVKIKAQTGYGQKTGLTKPEPLQTAEPARRPPFTCTAEGPEESLRAVLSSPTSRKSFSDYLDTTGNSNNKRDSNILRLWLAARAHSAALQFAEQLAEEIKSTCCQEFPDILEPTQNVEVSKIEDTVFKEMLHKEFPEFRRHSQMLPKGVQESLDKLVASPALEPEIPEVVKLELQQKPLSIINPVAEQEQPEQKQQLEQKQRQIYPVSADKTVIDSKKEVMLDSLIKPVPSTGPAPVMKVSGGQQRKIQLSASKHRSFHAVQSFKVDDVADQIPELPKIPLAYRNSAPSTVNMPVLKSAVAVVEHAGVVETTEACTATIADTPALNSKQNEGKKTLADIVRNEIMDKAESTPETEKFDLAAMGIVKRNRAALMQRMAALEGAKI
ncbi:uncharacterized protein LAJ45_03333 [Morchella importuna]|uniref:uncharacterized protein n=1 Tax=Morchella importuna TaxID=1174673 RepID=UPI001E8DA4AC|nr:uncharacterized protein LAJ45_03333 [Morchella importuna]KAH8152493.1 hypothetical protein LAJ45_03333 [Morchella importuna]